MARIGDVQVFVEIEPMAPPEMDTVQGREAWEAGYFTAIERIRVRLGAASLDGETLRLSTIATILDEEAAR